jgi:alkylation response protein AidB-like acyl-CoA dehydrogenase
VDRAVSAAGVEDLAVYREQVRQWLAAQDIPEAPTDVDGRFDTIRRWHKRLYEAGYLGVDWPVEHGGQGLTALHQATVYEELIAADAPLPIALGNLVVVGPSLLAYGTPEQKQRYLRPLLACDEMWCQGFSEPGAGSDLASLRTRASLDGDHFVINGQKVWTSYCHRADFIALLVRTDPDAEPHRGISYLLVPTNTPGITIRRIKQLTGDAEFSEVFYDNVRIPVENLLGPLNEGWKVAMRSLGNERSRIIITRHGVSQAAFRRIVEALRTWETPPPPSVVRRVAEARVLLAALEAQVRSIVARLQRGDPPSGLDSLDKLVLTEVEQIVFALGYDLLGPFRLVSGETVAGLDSERWIHDWLYSRSWSISGGTTQIQRNIVAERVLGLPRT